MAFFRSPILRRVIYAIVFGLALVRLSTRSHSEPLPIDEPLQRAEIAQPLR